MILKEGRYLSDSRGDEREDEERKCGERRSNNDYSFDGSSLRRARE